MTGKTKKSVSTEKSSKKAPSKRRTTTVPENFTAKLAGTKYGVLDELVGYNVRRAQVVIYADYFVSIGDSSITPQRFAALVVIGANPGLQQVRIAKILGVARPGATALVDFWESRDCVERREGESDRRSYGIHLTDAGRKELARLKKIIIKHDKEILDCLSSEERKQLMSLLSKIYLNSSN